MGEREEEALIPGLPYDIALDCLARVPHRFQPGLRPVCRQWRDLVTAASFRCHRERIGTAEDLIFMVQALVPVERGEEQAGGEEDAGTGGEIKEQSKDGAAGCRRPVYALSLYNATLGSWHRVATGEAAVPMFAQCAAVGGRLVLVGGWDPATLDPVPDVRVLDLATGEWRAGAPMAAARSFFACAVAGGKVYVAGGHDGQKNALRSAETYDVRADEWTALPPMADERDECQGVAWGGRFWAVSGYGTENQGRFDPAAECYNPASGTWSREEGVLGDGEVGGGASAPSTSFFAVPAVANDAEEEETLLCVDCGSGGGRREVREFEGREKGWRMVGQVSEGLRSSPCAAVIGGGGDRVFVMGADGEGGHGAWVLDVASRKWARVDTPAGYSGLAYSAAALRL